MESWTSQTPGRRTLVIGDPTLAKEHLGWEPKITFADLVKRMAKHDLALAEQEARMKS